MPEFIEIGTIGKYKGLDGHLRARIHADYLPKLKSMAVLYLAVEGSTSIPYLPEELSIEPSGDAIVKFEDIDTKEEAQKLTGKAIYIDITQIKKGKKERVWKSMQGYTIIEGTKVIGVIETVYDMPGQHLAAVMLNGVEALIPLNNDIITKVDDKAKQVHMVLPEGLLDIYTS